MKLSNFLAFLEELKEDIYPQPIDEGHKEWQQDGINELIPEEELFHVLDVGCGEGDSFFEFSKRNINWTGIVLGDQDYKEAIKKIENRFLVFKEDFHFTFFEDKEFDLVYARHVLEHSPMPLLALMEWNRISNRYLMLIQPAPEYWGWAGRNHYSMMKQKQLEFLLDRAGWEIQKKTVFLTSHPLFLKYYNLIYPPPERVWMDDEKPVEYRYLCVRKDENNNNSQSQE